MTTRRLIDVDITDRSDGRVPVWDATSGTHVYEDKTAGANGANLTGAYDIEGDGTKPHTDAGMGDEFADDTDESGSSNGLATKWTAVGGSSSTIDLYTDNIADSVYDLTTRAGSMLVQTDVGDDIGFRQDDMLANDESIVASIWVPSPHDASATNNTLRVGVYVNTDNTLFTSGTYRGLVWDGSDDGMVILYSGTTIYSQHQMAPAGGRLYFRISRVSDVLHFFVSKDGIGWVDCGSVAIGTFDNFWLGFQGSLASADGSAISVVNWVRHVASTAYDLW